MDVVVLRCSGLDVAKDEVVACIRVPAEAKAGRRQEIRTFPTFTSGLEALAHWLVAEGVSEVAMEATGQYWKPVCGSDGGCPTSGRRWSLAFTSFREGGRAGPASSSVIPMGRPCRTHVADRCWPAGVAPIAGLGTHTRCRSP